MNIATVISPVTNVYRSPKLDSEVVTQAKFGETVRVKSYRGEWLEVEVTYDDYPGWVLREATREEDWLSGRRTAAITSLFANVYSGPRVQHQLLTTLPFGVRIPVLGRSEREGWHVVELGTGEQAFLQEGDLDLFGSAWQWSTLPELRSSLVATARRLLGVPYRWGGTSSFGIDCSGFVQFLYRLHGIFLPRDANQQAGFERTRRISRDEIVPGDLLFFAKYGHIGMAVSHHEFIHATTYQVPVVQVSLIDDPHWVEITDEVRRYVVEVPSMVTRR